MNSNKKSDHLLFEIEQARKDLLSIAFNNALNSLEVVKASQKLDMLLNHYENKRY